MDAVSSTRTWTVEELDIAHPEVKAAGWSWELWDDGRTPVAYDDRRSISVTQNGRVVAATANGSTFSPPRDIALAVILASRGLPSLAVMADRLDKIADDEHVRADMLACGGLAIDCINRARAHGRALQAAEIAAMLRGES